MNTDRAQKQKRKFYETFALLEQDEDDTIDTGLEESKKAMRKVDKIQPVSTTSIPPSLARAKSDVVVKSNHAKKIAAAQLLPTQQVPSTLRRATSLHTSDRPKVGTKGPPPSAIPQASRRGKQKYVPEAKQIFKGMLFYFFPNSDVHQARRLRIAKAIEYGASWQKDFNEYVTHIIVDSNLDYKDILLYLKLDSLPSSVIVVNDTYPSDCLMYGFPLDHKRPEFAVPGTPSAAEEATITNKQQVSPEKGNSDTSLQLKKAGKTVVITQQSTQSEERSTPLQSSRRVEDNVNSMESVSEPGSSIAIPLTVPFSKDFDEAITQAKQMPFLSIVMDDDLEVEQQTSIIGSTLDGTGELGKKLINADRFQCMQAHTVDKTIPNAEVIAVLEQMADYYTSTKDEWRSRGYRKAIATLRNHKQRISTKEEAMKLPNIGVRLAEKIEEIATTHRLRRLEDAQAEPRDQALQLFLKIYGVGLAQANKWISQGYRTIDDLAKNVKLTSNQVVGIDHYNDFSMRIPRAEVKQHGDIVLAALHKVDSDFELAIGGSYRRGSMTSGDIDCIITHPQHSIIQISHIMYSKVIPFLKSQEFIKAELATSAQSGSKWLGASCLPNSTIWRRIDFLFVPADEIGAAMIYFTGNDIFNRSIRLLAGKKGFRLNQRGLFKNVMTNATKEKMTDGTLVEGRSERKIFEILGVPWREPFERVI